MKGLWWKLLTIALLLFTVIWGFFQEVPRMYPLQETIRNLYFHVPMWFGMIIILGASVVYSIKYLKNPLPKYDNLAVSCVNVGVMFGVLGMITGMFWAQFTWGYFWSGDPKQNAAAVGLLIYFAYGILRGLFEDDSQKKRISAIYNIFAYATLIPLMFILPRLTDSLHPGNGGNPGFNAYDLDSKLRMVFYPAVIGWTLLGAWIVDINARMKNSNDQLDEIQFANDKVGQVQ
ncbi:cytochrome c biogenesis protein [Flammeovirgaceae bacterium SG7u.111]|nr:cytochrome c biogenesis protein [Flammeovirgaceae bacterium SG7u.132]WPO38754.1 cytochrome c biogenesis protein [Flammeovirgaceae bacterium SG7u.111]